MDKHSDLWNDLRRNWIELSDEVEGNYLKETALVSFIEEIDGSLTNIFFDDEE